MKITKQIDNWCMYGVKSASVSVCEVADNLYTPQITIILDDGNESDQFEDMKVITLIVGNSYEDAKDALYNTIKDNMVQLFGKISAEGIVLNQYNEIVEKYDFNTDFSDYEDDEEELDRDVMEAMLVKRMNKPTIH